MPENSFIDAVEVTTPCSEEWDEMSGNDVVRFCSHCSKNVNDLSGMTRRQAEKLVRRSGGSLCVRYRKHPETGLPVFAQKFNRIAARSGITAGVLGAALLFGDGAYAQGESPAAEIVQAEQTPRHGDPTGRLSGYVTDPNNAVLPFALVSITNKETYEYKTTNANAEGFYEFADLTPGTYSIKFEAGGFAARDVESVYVGEAGVSRRDARLDLQQVAEVVEVKGTKYENWEGVTVGIVMEMEARNPLVQAVLDQDLEDVKARVMMRARVNVRDKAYEGISPLHAAVESGNVEIARYLLQNGAKANIRDFKKRTPLMMLDDDATPEMFRLLISYGAKVDLVDKQRNTVLHHFAAYDKQGMIGLLVSYGVPVDAYNKEGETALMIAAANENPSNIEALIRGGADPNRAGRGGKTAWTATEDPKTRTLLETLGAAAVR